MTGIETVAEDAIYYLQRSVIHPDPEQPRVAPDGELQASTDAQVLEPSTAYGFARSCVRRFRDRSLNQQSTTRSTKALRNTLHPRDLRLSRETSAELERAVRDELRHWEGVRR